MSISITNVIGWDFQDRSTSTVHHTNRSHGGVISRKGYEVWGATVASYPDVKTTGPQITRWEKGELQLFTQDDSTNLSRWVAEAMCNLIAIPEVDIKTGDPVIYVYHFIPDVRKSTGRLKWIANNDVDGPISAKRGKVIWIPLE